MLLYDYGLSTLEQYGLKAESTCRTRGAILCQSSEGLLILREFHGSEKKLKKQQELLELLEKNSFLVDGYLSNLEGNLVTMDKDHISYTLQHWRDGRECDPRSREDLKRSVIHLAKLHKVMRMPLKEEYIQRPLDEEYTRHNQELRKIRRFIRKKRPSNVFENDYLASVEFFLEKGEEALRRLQHSSYKKLREQAIEEGRICHGEYHQHNVCMGRDWIMAVNFSHWNYDIQISDLYRFLRKILEKYNWDKNLAAELIGAYHEIEPVSRELWEYLGLRFIYPEKYWKIADYYYSHNKAWISEKTVEKLETVIRQRKKQEEFIDHFFSVYPF